jgi:hypothetical protein
LNSIISAVSYENVSKRVSDNILRASELSVAGAVGTEGFLKSTDSVEPLNATVASICYVNIARSIRGHPCGRRKFSVAGS